MSLINDALKRARQAPPREQQGTFAPLAPAAGRPASAGIWLIPAIVIFLVVAAAFFIGGVMVHRTERSMTSLPAATVAATQPAGTVGSTVAVPAAGAQPILAQPVATKTAAINAPEPAPANPPEMPTLQAIFYSPTTPAAILDGKMVRPGDVIRQLRVTDITKSTVTLSSAGGRTVKLIIDH